MHLPDGILPPVVCLAGAVCAGGITLAALRGLRDRDVPRLAVLSAAFFALGALHVRIGPGSVHFLLTGLLAAVLGWRSFAAVTVGVVMHAVLLQHGGLTVVGVNACVLGLPVLLAGAVLQRLGSSVRPATRGWCAVLAVVACYLLSMGLFFSVAAFADERLAFAFGAWAASSIPVMVLEAIATGVAVAYLAKVDQEVFTRCVSQDYA